MGRNGVGKTTLVNSIVGFTPPRRGKIVFKGEDITHNSSFETVRTGMGLVPQGRRVFPTLSVEENLLVAERNTERHGWNLERVYTMFPRLQRAAHPARQDAVRRRAADARHRPRADDQPGLPDHGRAVRGAGAHHHPGLWEAIGKLKQEGMSILLVEQNASLALKLVDYVHVMSKGQVVYSARPQELWANDEIKHSYLGI